MIDSLFTYCLQIADREFMIAVTRDGTIHWDDYQQRRRLRSDNDRALELHAIAGSERARQRLAAEIDEFTVSFPLSAEMLARFTEAARLFDAGEWTDAHEQELDRHLLPLFWAEVNPHLGASAAAARVKPSDPYHRVAPSSRVMPGPGAGM